MTEERLVAALEAAGWNISRAAQNMGYSRQSVYTALRRFGIERRPMDPDLFASIQKANGQRGGRPRKDAA